MTVADALIVLAGMGTLLPIIVSPFLLTPISVGAVASGTYVIAQGSGHRVLVRWLGVLTALFLLPVG